MSVRALLALALAADASAQEPSAPGVLSEFAAPLAPAPSRELLEQALWIARGERAAALEQAWIESSAAARRAARRAMQAARPSGAGLLAGPSLDELTRGWRALRAVPSSGGEQAAPSASAADLQRQVDALDLRVVPAHFRSRAADREGELGEAMTVYLAPLGGLPPPRSSVATLWWIGPDGTELRARREEIGAEAFSLPGFEMYLRPPHSAPGRWRLVLELEQGGQRARGWPVDVECIADAGALAPRAGADAQFLAECWSARERLGLRLPVGLSSAHLRALAEGRTERGTWRPLCAHRAAAPGPREWAWGACEAPTVRGLLVAVLGPNAAAERWAAGPAGQAWRALARARQWAVAALAVDSSCQGPALTQAFAALQASFAAEPGAAELPCTVLLEGAATGLVQSALLGEARRPFQVAICAGELTRGDPEQVLPGTTRLVFAPGGASDLPEQTGECTWVEAEEPLFLDLARLPALAERWLALRAASGAAAGPR